MNSIDRRTLIAGTLAAGLASRLGAQTAPPGRSPAFASDPTETIDLWPSGAPGLPRTRLVETVDERSTDPQRPDRAVYGITRPRLVVFRPTKPNGSAVLAIPGGAYRWVVVDKEGYEIGRWLAARGYTVFVLFYRLPGEGWQAGPDVALADAQRAMRLIRSRAQDYGIVSTRVAAMGFSAGGHVCGDLATRFAARTYKAVDAADRFSPRPDLAALIYAVQSMTLPLAHTRSRTSLIGQDASPALERAHTPSANVGPETPPCFLVHAEDDPAVDVANTQELRSALKASKLPVETHLFETGGHGFGLRGAVGKPAGAWPELFVAWGRSRGFG